MKIECKPRGLCSWNFDLAGGDHSASVELQHTERGFLRIDGAGYEVKKHGWLSGFWTLEQDGRVVCSARKPSAFRRRFQIEGEFGSATLRTHSLFSRSMSLTGSGLDCMIVPAHAFTRRATITGPWDDFRPVAFGFWLAAIMWRRQQRSNNSN